jgi:hypothetical protein
VLPTDLAAFWQGKPIGGSGDATPPSVSAPLARRLGGFPFWRGETDFLDALARVYEQATARGVQIHLPTSDP